MSEYRIFLTREFDRALAAIDSSRRQRLQQKLETMVWERLRAEPHHGQHIKKLQGYDPPTWRYRIGDYRVFYIIDEQEQVVALTTVAHRQQAYRR